MPSLIDLRRRIRAVKSTQQITKAMKMIAASRLRRAQERVVSARPFAQRMLKVLNGLVSRVDQDTHPLLRTTAPPNSRPLLIVVSADRGLCGSFNSNIIKAAGQFIVKEGQQHAIALGLIGRKGRDFFRRRGFDVRYEAVGIFQRLSFADAAALGDAAIEEFTSKAKRPLGRPRSISTSRRRRRFSRTCCRGTCRYRSTGLCSNPTPRSSRRR
jgi:F-type H+-transporting ATPase subunit gamma